MINTLKATIHRRAIWLSYMEIENKPDLQLSVKIGVGFPKISMLLNTYIKNKIKNKEKYKIEEKLGNMTKYGKNLKI